ncbi:hypothetical protein EJ04DRAFT_52402 [Polyplosphaeria fusca]|uniref:Uncharacterized protein n=1 Tax=Polyplosphaeria fusca TaxID=682080 RepID=A0A9P4R7T8_9PLEO|nr:hypothetical protein EJ04DRAFT_52402 [Polyplosphaeria fusca]
MCRKGAHVVLLHDSFRTCAPCLCSCAGLCRVPAICSLQGLLLVVIPALKEALARHRAPFHPP